MNPNARRAIPAIAALVAILVLGILAWLPFDPLEDPAGPVDAMIPRSVDSAWRFDGPSLLHSPFALAAWDRPEARDLRVRWDVEERFLAPMRRIEGVFTEASLGLADAPSLEGDLMPAEVVVATRGDDVLVATRISSRARAVEFVRKLPAWRAERLGVRFEGRYIVLREDSAHPVWVARYRDVLFASTSRALLDDVDALTTRGTPGLSGRADYRDALRLGRPAGQRILGWVVPQAVASRVHRKDPEAPEAADPFWWDLVSAKDAAPVKVEIDLGHADALAATVRGTWGDGLPKALEPLRAPGSPDAPSLAVRAREYAVSTETFAAGGIRIHASAALRMLLASQPPERQSVFEEALASTGESLDTLSASLASHFDDGVGFVVARVREADQALRGEDAGLVHAIPATLVVFRLKGPRAADAVLAELRARAEALFGAPLGDQVEVLADGTRVHTLRREGLAGQWELLRPAFAFRGQEMIFSTHEGFLRRALTRTTATGVPERERPGRTAVMDVFAGPLRRWMDDQAWEAADRATWRDWAAVRAEVNTQIPVDSKWRDQDRETYLDVRMREIRKRRVQQEIPEAAEQYRRRWEWLAKLGDAQVSVEVEGGDVEVRGRVRFAETK